MNIENCRIIQMLVILETFSLLFLFVFVACAADQNNNGYTFYTLESHHTRDRQKNAFSRDTGKQTSSNKQMNLGCENCRPDEVTGKNNQKDGIYKIRRNRGHQKRTSKEIQMEDNIKATTNSNVNDQKHALEDHKVYGLTKNRRLKKTNSQQAMKLLQNRGNASSKQLPEITIKRNKVTLTYISKARKELNISGQVPREMDTLPIVPKLRTEFNRDINNKPLTKQKSSSKTINNDVKFGNSSGKRPKLSIKQTTGDTKERTSEVLNPFKSDISKNMNKFRLHGSSKNKLVSKQNVTMNASQSGIVQRHYTNSRIANTKQAKESSNFSSYSFETPFLKQISVSRKQKEKTNLLDQIINKYQADKPDKEIQGVFKQDKDDVVPADGTGKDSASIARQGFFTGAERRGSHKENRSSYLLSAIKSDQQISAEIRRSSQELMDHFRGLLQTLSKSLQRLKSSHDVMYNVTRYDIMAEVRKMIKNINEANNQSYAGIFSATQFIRELMLKHRSKNVRNDDRLHEIPNKLLESQDFYKNFQQQLNHASDVKRNVEVTMKNVSTLYMRGLQGESRLKQVQDLFYINYDRAIIRDLHDYLTISIFQLNSGIKLLPQLEKLSKFKVYLDHIKNVLFSAKDLLAKSVSEVHNGYRQMQANNEIYRQWQYQVHNSQQLKGSSDLKNSTSSGHLNNQERLILEVKRHVSKLQSQQNELQRILVRHIDIAKALTSRKSIAVIQLEVKLLYKNLRSLMKEMFSSLDTLRKYIGSKTKITFSLKCIPHTEGSGFPDNTDDEDLCEEEGSGFEIDNDKKVFARDDEDFTFADEPVDVNRFPVTSIKQLRLDLTTFTSKLLNKGQQIYERMKSLQQSLSDLHQQYNLIDASVSDIERSIDTQNKFILKIEASSSHFKEIQKKIQNIFQKVANFKSLKLDDAVIKAKLRLEKAEKRPKVDGKPHEEEKNSDNKTVQMDGGFNYLSLLKQGEEIKANHADLRSRQLKAIENCGKIDRGFASIKNNISSLRQQVEKARQILSNLQLSISKSGKGHITVPITQTLQDTAPFSLTTSIRMCVKPKTLSGTPLLVKGNNSISYGITLDDGELTVTAYDKEHDDIGAVIMNEMSFTEQWYILEIQRTGKTLVVSAVSPTGAKQKQSKMLNYLELLQPQPVMAYVGGVPANLRIGGEPWEGCVGELIVNGQALTLFTTSNKDIKTNVCSDHCFSGGHKQSLVFNGNGFVHFIFPENERISLITLTFRTNQKMTGLLSVTNKSNRFYLSVVLDNGALKIESSSLNENIVLLSFNNSLNDGHNHVLMIVYKGNKIYPELDGLKETFSVERGTVDVLSDLSDGVLVGAFVSKSKQFLSATSFRPFIGCLHDIIINSEKMLLSNAVNVHNVFYGSCEDSNLGVGCTEKM